MERQIECDPRAILADNAICYNSVARLLLLLVTIKRYVAQSEAARHGSCRDRTE